MNYTIIPVREGEHYLEVLIVHDGDCWKLLSFNTGESDTSEIEQIIDYIYSTTGLSFDVISIPEDESDNVLNQESDHVIFTGFVNSSSNLILNDSIEQMEFVHPKKAYRKINSPTLRSNLNQALSWLTGYNNSIRYLANNLKKMQ